jgi:hypothetical protein
VVIHERSGSLAFVVGEDLERLIRAALALPEASHFAAVGSRDVAKWFHPAARTRETPFVDEPELPAPGDKYVRGVGCRLDSIARESVARFVIKCTSKPKWPGSVLWHWWLYSEDHVLFSAYDWPSLIWIDPDLAGWAAERVLDGSLARAANPEEL